MKNAWQVALIAVVCLTIPAFGQDSVSINTNGGNGLPGDALSLWNTDHQCAEYVVDLVPLTTSWGNTFAVAPLIKSSKGSSDYFNNFLSAQSLSRVQALGVAYPVASYDLWTATPGAGVHPTENSMPGTITPTGMGNQFGVVLSEFGTSDAGVTCNGIIGGVVNYSPTNPNRLYVKRILAAVNGSSGSQNLSAYGVGAADEQGNIMFRADTGSYTPTNVYHVDLLARNCAALNVVGNAGGSDAAATNWIVHNQSSVHNTPNIGPASIFGVPYLLASNFSTQYAYGPVTTTPPSYTTSHLAAGVTDHRGGLSYMTKNHPCIPGSTHGVAAILGKDENDLATIMDLFGVGASGAPVAGSPVALSLPALVTDNITGMTNIQGDNEFDHYHSQVAFNGGNGQIALNVDQAGRLLAAAVVYHPSTFDYNPLNYIAVARLDPATCDVEWTMAAYSSDTAVTQDSGKPILGPGGMQIGTMTTMDVVTGGDPYGPSVSAPMIDSVGNIWFIAAVALTHYKDGTQRVNQYGDPIIDYDSALIRGVYDPAAFGYRLELILELGDTFEGANSGREWTISFMGIADSNSVSSGTCWSSNISETGHLGLPPAADLPTEDPRSLGGLILNVDIVYDVDADGDFDDPTSSYGDPTSADESYQVALYIGANAAAVLFGDVNGDGNVNNFDIAPFVFAVTHTQEEFEDAYPNGCYDCADVNGDGTVNNFDISPFVSLLV
ncbi:MAG: hypothetical protein PVJ57_18385 [Phycisphaerae bacterium]|jgi:hypothetical protein